MNIHDFLNDPQGKRYPDVVRDISIDFDGILEFFNDPERQQRMEIAQKHLRVPPLGGVVIELEQHPAADYLRKNPKHVTRRLRQAIGVIVKIIMEQKGWTKAGKKGYLTSLSDIFTVSETYIPPAKS